MDKVKSYIKYIGSSPRFALRREWVSGQKVSLTDIYESFKDKCQSSSELDLNFISWFADNYIRSSDFEINLDETEFSIHTHSQDPVLETDQTQGEYWDDTDESNTNTEDSFIKVESSNLKSAKSYSEAENKLRNFRHPDYVGEVVKTKEEVKTNLTGPDVVKSLPKAGTTVLTGDDLEKRKEISGKNVTQPVGFVIDGNGAAIKAIPTLKEEEDLINSKMANLSGRSKILISEDLEDSKVITGDSFVNSSEEVKEALVEEKPVKVKRKVNTNFQAHQNNATSASRVEVLPDHIVGASSEKEALRLIKMCKNSTTLKVAKIYLQDRGNYKLIDEIEDQLRRIPPGQ